MLRQHNGIVLKVKLEAHHVLRLLDVQNLEHLLTDVQLIVLLESCGGDTGTVVALSLDIIIDRHAARISRLDTRPTIILADLTARFAPLAQLTAYLRH